MALLWRVLEEVNGGFFVWMVATHMWNNILFHSVLFVDLLADLCLWVLCAVFVNLCSSCHLRDRNMILLVQS